MATANVGGVLTIAGLSLSINISETGTGQIAIDETLAMAYAGTITSGAGTTSGVIEITTADEGDNFTAADQIDVYLATGTGTICYNGNISDVTDETITVAGFTNNLPANGTAVYVAVRKTIHCLFDADDMQMIAATCPGRCHIVFETTGDSDELQVDIAAGESWLWALSLNAANPIAGHDIVEIEASQASITSTGLLQLGVLYDSTP